MSIKRLIKASQALIEPYDWIFKVPQTRWLALQGIKSLHGNSIAYLATRRGSNEPRREKNRIFAYAKTKAQISFAVNAKLISAFVFATRIV